MSANPAPLQQYDPNAFRFYRHALEVLAASDVPFLLGGAYAFGYYTGISRHTKDLDLFVRPAHVRPTLDVFADAGYRTEMIFSHWLAKVNHGADFVVVSFSSGNGLCVVDDRWFEHACAAEVLGVGVRLIPVEEMIWQKAFIMERERFAGADGTHLLRARGRRLDWDRLLARFGPRPASAAAGAHDRGASDPLDRRGPLTSFDPGSPGEYDSVTRASEAGRTGDDG